MSVCDGVAERCPTRAASLVGAAIALFQRSPHQPTSDERNWLEPLVQSVMAQLDEAEYQRAWQAG